MPFKPAIEYMKTRHKKRFEDWFCIRRPTWSTTEAGGVPALIALFDSKPENAEWEGLTQNLKGDRNLVMGVRARIAWLCSCRNDLRRQFASQAADTPRMDMERHRYYYFHNFLRFKALERLDIILYEERRKKITE